ncbi:hypothetical protein BIFGAL_03027 [Bifidobacterium gallicum DSM 20093 = LMG 11596]|nr:hypothetical protein BIFGAL_03027 [Bifidobacterium gallicum DSM 20093 = LMG 11596]
MQCVDSIRRYCKNYDYRIVVVDNNSSNGSYERLLDNYGNDADILLVHNATNEGFARGNNVGYRLCRDKLECQFIVAINNDAMLADDRFIPLCIADFEDTGCGVIGPDIISTRDNLHQNPIYDIIDTHDEVKRQIRHFTLLLKLEKLHLYQPLVVLRGMLTGAGMNSSSPYKRNTASANLDIPYKLHGACLIFTPNYIQCYEDCFDPGTFLYFEEDILLMRCRKAGLKMLYDSRFCVKHMEDASTDSMKQNARDKQIFVWNNYIHSLNVLKQYI